MTAHRMRHGALSVATASVVVLGVAGCSGGSAPSTMPTPGYAEVTELEGLLREIAAASEGDEAERFALVEERIAACMRDEGFSYLLRPAAPAPMNPDGLGVLPGTREFAEQYGYGITTNPWGYLDETSSSDIEDPNAAILDAMSEQELEAYHAALYGKADPDQLFDWQSGGCADLALREVNDVVPGLDDGALMALREELVRVLSVTSDPSLEPLVADWAECMADAGYPGLKAVDEAAVHLAERAAVSVANEELTGEEIQVATADFSCREQVGYDQALRRIQVQRQDAFYAANRAELEAWRDALREGRRG